MYPTGANDATSDGSAQLFRAWQHSVGALRGAERRRADYTDILRLCTDVIRTRNTLIQDRVHAGWDASDDILRHVTTDELLLLAGDDNGLGSSPQRSAMPHRRAEEHPDTEGSRGSCRP